MSHKGAAGAADQGPRVLAMLKQQPEHSPEVLARVVRVEQGASAQQSCAWRGRFIFEPPAPLRPDARAKGWARKRARWGA
jgi:hypothetical protein